MQFRGSGYLVAIALLVACYRPVTEWTQTTPYPLETGPYVLIAGPNEAIVAFQRTGSDRAINVEWSAPNGQSGTQRAERNDTLYSARLTKLPRGLPITYGVMSEGKTIGTGTFRVGTAPGETKFRFATFGDTRTNHRIHRAVIDALALEDIDFFLHTGDMVERGGKLDQWVTFFQIERPLMMKAAIIPAIGNHDLGNRGDYNRLFFLDDWTNGKRYYVTDWGNVRLISLDLEIACQDRCRQYRFVERALAEGAAADKIMIMFLHYPPFSSGEHGSNMAVQGPIRHLAKTYGVELVIAGHDHNYERTNPIDGTTYIVSGSAGAPIRPVRPQPFTAEARTEPHYVLLDVDGMKLSIRAVNLKGEVFDNTVIPLNPPGGPVIKPAEVSPP